MPGRGYTETGMADVGSLTGLENPDVDPKEEGAVITCISSHFSNNMPLNIIFSSVVLGIYPYFPPENWKINCIGPKHHGFECILHMSKVVFSCTIFYEQIYKFQGAGDKFLNACNSVPLAL